MIDRDTIKAGVPATLRSYITDEFVAKLHTLSTDPDEAEVLRDNAITYMDAIKTGKYSMEHYINAIKFTTYLTLGSKSLEAWVKVFPQKYARLVSNNTPEKSIYAHAGAYKQSKLVVTLLERALIPIHIMNAPYMQEAINKQVELMRTAKSERIQMEAAANLMRELKQPETTTIAIDIGVTENSMLTDLKNATVMLAAQQQQLIQSGAYSAKEIAHQSLVIEGSVEHV